MSECGYCDGTSHKECEGCGSEMTISGHGGTKQASMQGPFCCSCRFGEPEGSNDG